VAQIEIKGKCAQTRRKPVTTSSVPGCGGTAAPSSYNPDLARQTCPWRGTLRGSPGRRAHPLCERRPGSATYGLLVSTSSGEADENDGHRRGRRAGRIGTGSSQVTAAD
jgi:hypothetical protein